MSEQKAIEIAERQSISLYLVRRITKNTSQQIIHTLKKYENITPNLTPMINEIVSHLDDQDKLYKKMHRELRRH